jgi:hypothetical protein
MPEGVEVDERFLERLASLGFLRDPFEFLAAEQMPLEILEETFVYHPDFEQHILDRNRSAVLVASRGSGKTAGRRLLEMALDKQQRRSIRGQIPHGNADPSAPLVIIYDDFEQVITEGRLQDHEQSLLGAIAEATCQFINAHPSQFLTQHQTIRDWWWAFLLRYLRGRALEYRILGEGLAHDLNRRKDRLPPFQPGSSLQQILIDIQEQSAQIGIDRLFVLIDGVDGYRSNLEALVAPLLNELVLRSPSQVIWKFFLPDLLNRVVEQSAGYRTGRLYSVPIQWDQDILEELLRQRLQWASDGAISDIAQLCDEELTRTIEVEQQLVKMALSQTRFGPPRGLLYLGSELLRPKDASAEQSGATLLTLNDWNHFCKRMGEIFPPDGPDPPTALPSPPDKAALKKQIEIHRQRLSILEQQAAYFGVIAPPNILMEINDLKETIKYLELQSDN